MLSRAAAAISKSWEHPRISTNMRRMLKKLLIWGLLVMLVYVIFFHPVTSKIIFSKRTLLGKVFELSRYAFVSLLKLLWRILEALAFFVIDVLEQWNQKSQPAYNIQNFQELYQLYLQVERQSGLPWQVFWGIHAEETNLGRNLGATPILSVLPADQKKYFYQMCRELDWDPEAIYGSHKGAIGPFQFIPETWIRNAVDANGDGRRDPFDVADAAFSAANYLKQRGGRADLRKALWHYNQDPRYVARVMRYLQYS